MNKYQEALEYFLLWINPSSEEFDYDNYFKHRQNLKELIDKETPMKVKYLKPYNVKCPYCDYILGKDFIPTNEREKTYHQYCCRCGQRLDWSGDDE